MGLITQVALDDFPQGPMMDEENRMLNHEWHVFFSSLIDKLPRIQSFTVTLDPGSVTANSTREETITVKGVTVNDIAVVNKPTNTTGLMIEARVSAADTITVRFGNVTTGNIDPGSESYKGFVLRL